MFRANLFDSPQAFLAIKYTDPYRVTDICPQHLHNMLSASICQDKSAILNLFFMCQEYIHLLW